MPAMRRGIAVSPGVAIGTAYVIHEIFVNPDRKSLADSEVTAELAKYETSRDKAGAELRALERKVASQVGAEEAAIFAVHRAILRDTAFTNKIRKWVCEDRISAAAALRRLLDEYTVIFTKTKDAYLQERLNDIRDVVLRLSTHLSDMLKPEVGPDLIKGPLIVIADELLPSQAVALGEMEVHGIVTQRGSQTSHAAIVARSRGIPAVSGVKGIVKKIKTGDTVIVDGRNGHIQVHPNSETVTAYNKLVREFVDLKDALASNRDDPALTKDGAEIRLQANINSVADAKAAEGMGATGVGLYRTEYLYLTHANVPDEDEQYQNYRQIVAASPNHNVTVRTLDIGGDKTVAYLGHDHNEANPTQIRAIVRAASEFPQGTVRLMFPMVTTVEEIRRLRSMVRRAYKELNGRGIKTKEVPIGMMLEVPAAAVSMLIFVSHSLRRF